VSIDSGAQDRDQIRAFGQPFLQFGQVTRRIAPQLGLFFLGSFQIGAELGTLFKLVAIIDYRLLKRGAGSASRRIALELYALVFPLDLLSPEFFLSFFFSCTF
jgi:hypothetical protein